MTTLGRARPRSALLRSVALAAGGLLLSGCGVLSTGSAKSTDNSDGFTVTSQAFRDGQPIPARFLCPALGGTGLTPPLRWSGAPAGTRAYAIVADDSVASDGEDVHWVIANIPGSTQEIVEGAQLSGTVEGLNTAGTVGYSPPCPAKGQPVHLYRFTVYALGGNVTMSQGAELKDSLPDIAKLTIGWGRLTGNYGGV